MHAQMRPVQWVTLHDVYAYVGTKPGFWTLDWTMTGL